MEHKIMNWSVNTVELRLIITLLLL